MVGILKARFARCIDWSQINKNDYLDAMTMSVADSTRIKQLLLGALTDKIDDREMFMKGIDYSYYYEEEKVINYIPIISQDKQYYEKNNRAIPLLRSLHGTGCQGADGTFWHYSHQGSSWRSYSAV